MTGAGNTVMGYQAGVNLYSGQYNTLIGANAGNTLNAGQQNIIINTYGIPMLGDFSRCIWIGNNNSGEGFSYGIDASNIAVITGPFIQNLYVGGYRTVIDSVYYFPTFTINAASAWPAADTAATNLRLAGGRATGTGSAGDVIFATSTTGSTGTTLQTLTNRWWIKGHFGTLSNVSNPVSSSLYVSGSSVFSGSLIVTGSMRVTGSTTLLGTTNYNGNLTPSSTAAAYSVGLSSTSAGGIITAYTNQGLSPLQTLEFGFQSTAFNHATGLSNPTHNNYSLRIYGTQTATTGGGGIYSDLKINPTYNFSANANDAWVYGISYEPTLTNITSASVFAFRNTVGTNSFNQTSGNTIIGSYTSSFHKLDVSGSGRFTTNLTVSGSLITTGSIMTTGSLNVTGSIIMNGSSFDTSWTPYTPVWTAASVNPAIGNGTIEGYYKLVGKTCFVRGNIAMGTTTTFGSGEWYVSMPFTASHADAILMTVTLLDNGSAWYNAILNGARAGFNFKTAIQYQNTGGTASDVNATQPFTWANSDRFLWNGSYEIA
jgi:cytoskeletal protein CcmA (bactofilin family)